MPVEALQPERGRKRVTLLGATGSIGSQARALLAHHAADFEVMGVTAHRDAAALAETAIALKAKVAVIADEGHYPSLKQALSGSGIAAKSGEAALCEVAAMPADCVIAGITGFAGLVPTLAAVRQGTDIALANKECLVAAGPVFMAELQRYGGKLLPVDSEHSAIFQVLEWDNHAQVEKLILTASGGPFFDAPAEKLAQVTPEDAVKHPNWSMGAKISVDSATMMNKGLELIEAHYLFDMPPDRLEAIIHPESIVHSMVQYCDGSVLAQLGLPDMTTPIAAALAWPERMQVPQKRLDLAEIGQLHFHRPDEARFPCLGLALEALRVGGAAPTVLNAANEVAVAAFLNHALPFMGISHVVAEVMERYSPDAPTSVDAIMQIDAEARELAKAALP